MNSISQIKFNEHTYVGVLLYRGNGKAFKSAGIRPSSGFGSIQVRSRKSDQKHVFNRSVSAYHELLIHPVAAVFIVTIVRHRTSVLDKTACMCSKTSRVDNTKSVHNRPKAAVFVRTNFAINSKSDLWRTALLFLSKLCVPLDIPLAYHLCVTTCSLELPKGRSYNIHVLLTTCVSVYCDVFMRLYSESRCAIDLILKIYINSTSTCSTTLLKLLIFSNLFVASILRYRVLFLAQERPVRPCAFRGIKIEDNNNCGTTTLSLAVCRPCIHVNISFDLLSFYIILAEQQPVGPRVELKLEPVSPSSD